MVSLLFIEELRKKLKNTKVIENEPMSKHTTFKSGGPAEFYLAPDYDDAITAIRLCQKENVPMTILGNGSNVLVSDAGIKGITIILGNDMSGIEFDGNLVTAQAGASLIKVSAEAAKNGLTGLEFASGIPGTIGGAVLMNAGAYGGEMAGILNTVTVIDKEGNLEIRDASDLSFGYRHSAMMDNGDIILAASMTLAPGEKDKIKEAMDKLRAQRMEKQPLEYPSAGSTFKRPEGYFAGKLIQDAGLSDYSYGDAAVSSKHCGFVINKGGASSSDIAELIKRVQDIVYKESGVMLEPEVRFIGEF